MVWMISFCVVFTLWVLTTFLLFKMSRQVRNYEYFYEDTLEDIGFARNIFDELVNHRSLLSDDPDIQRVTQVLAVTLDIINGYINYDRSKRIKSGKTAESEKKKKE